MLRESVIINDKNTGRIKKEKAFYLVFGALLCLTGILLMWIPAVSDKGLFVLIVGWLLLLSMVASLVRPFFYNRGFADFAMGILSSFYLALVGFAANSADMNIIDNYRVLLCTALLFAALSKILVFAQLMQRAVLPYLLISGFIGVAAAILMLMDIPSSSTRFLYWYSGLVILTGGLESFASRYKLSKENGVFRKSA